MTKKERARFNNRLRRIKAAGERKQNRDKLRAERRRYFPPRKGPSTSKLALAYIFGSCTTVQIFSMVAMWRLGDLSPLSTLIGSVVGEAISYCAYTVKAAKENTAGGIVYDAAMSQTEPPQDPPPDTTDPTVCG